MIQKLLISIVIAFAPLSFAIPTGRVKIKVQIENFDKKWIYAKAFDAKFKFPRQVIQDSHIQPRSKRTVHLTMGQYRDIQRQIYISKKMKKKKRKPSSK